MKLLEVDERPARALVEMAMQDRQGEHAILGVAEEAADARRAISPACRLSRLEIICRLFFTR